MAGQYPPKNINYNPNLITGDLLVDANEDYSVGIQDRILILSSTNASEKTILLNDFDEFICELTIIMLVRTNGSYKISTTIQGDISYSSAGTANTFIHLGNGS